MNVALERESAIQCKRIFHAGFSLEYKDHRILFDPILENPFSENCFVFPEVKESDLTEMIQDISQTEWTAIVITHVHDDHFSLRSLNYFKRNTPIYIYSRDPEAFILLGQMGFTQVNPIDHNFNQMLGPIKINVHQAEFNEVDQIFELDIDGFRILHLVDARPSERALQTLKRIDFDLILAPYQQMRELEIIAPHYELDSLLHSPDPALTLINLHSRYIVPFACQFRFEPWSWLNRYYFGRSYREFKNTICRNDPKAMIISMPPGTALQFERQSDGWVLANEPFAQKEDYTSYLSSLADSSLPKIQTTQEISTHLPRCDRPAQLSILNFISETFIHRFQDLESSDSTYFSKPWIYGLTIWNGGEVLAEAFFEVAGSWIEKLPETPTTVHWRTETVAYKLHRALTSKETLSSMYIRVNAPHPKLSLREDVHMVSPLEDPLIRVLFDNKLLAYQAQQLSELQSTVE